MCRQVRPHAKCMLLVNKADLLPDEVRQIWADYFNAQGISFTFWSAHLSAERQTAEGKGEDESEQGEIAPPFTPPEERSQIHILNEIELIDLLTREAATAMAASVGCGSAQEQTQGSVADSGDHTDDGARHITGKPQPKVPTVGFMGFPNVGKSSTINAMYGSKKTAVHATPGKTKHFQTLFVSPELRLCDCPGLVLPRLASSTADLVAAGVLPIDRLTDVSAAVTSVAQRVSRQQMLAILKVRLPKPKSHENVEPFACGSALDVLCAYASYRSWVNGSGLPDTSSAARAILKDYTSGKVVYCEWPPGKAKKCGWDDGLGTWTSQEDLLQYSAGTVCSAHCYKAVLDAYHVLLLLAGLSLSLCLYM